MGEKVKENGKLGNHSKREQRVQARTKSSKDLEVVYFSSSRGEPSQITTSSYCCK